MGQTAYKLFDDKVILRTRGRICEKPEELFSSGLFREVLEHCVNDLSRRNSPLLGIFSHKDIIPTDIQLLIDTLTFLMKIPPELVLRLITGAEQFFCYPMLFNDFIEYLYNYWRHLDRLVICDSEGQEFDVRPYRTFNNTVETLTNLVRSTYRDIQEAITGNHPRIYRQVSAGAEVAAIALPKPVPYPERYHKLSAIPVIRQVLIYPPLIFTPPMNKRTGSFERVDHNPLDGFNLIDIEDWLCYPARVGSLLIMIYFNIHFFELGFSLSNLFELADDEDLCQKPDAVFLFGVPDSSTVRSPSGNATIFYDDQQNSLLCATIPDSEQFGYFGYLKKMVLTLHNIKMMSLGRLPFHGALFNLLNHGKGSFNVLLMGDTGAGKSETLEALRQLGAEKVKDITVIADDMGSLEIMPDGRVLGYGTEVGAFVRLDDLQPGYAFGQIDRAIIMNASQVNARVVLPVTTYNNVIHGWPVDFVLYANNFEIIDETHLPIERFRTPDEALAVFAEGIVMSKGTTTSTGLVRNYFANVFGPAQYPELHDALARRYFKALFSAGVYVGQLRTQLGISGMERQGPLDAAQALLDALDSK
jgi:hypothetical protein